MDRNFYQFRSAWHLSAPRGDVFRALAELDDYPTWWPEVRAVHRVSDDARALTCRSFLPYDLDFTIRQSTRDRQTGILEARLSGDIEGFSRWTVTASSAGTLAVFDQEVVANKRLLQRLALIARPAFKGNHSLMMSHGRRGLRAYLAGMRLGRDECPGEDVPTQASDHRGPGRQGSLTPGGHRAPGKRKLGPEVPGVIRRGREGNEQLTS
ncbi:MAG: SRPBCC family protein [Pseudonocardiaceae bacterium]